jgi:hypothetical protein
MPGGTGGWTGIKKRRGERENGGWGDKEIRLNGTVAQWRKGEGIVLNFGFFKEIHQGTGFLFLYESLYRKPGAFYHPGKKGETGSLIPFTF